MRENMALLRWLETAVSGIRFSPDRDRVRQELRAHIEDKAADFQRIFPDITEDEARDRALAGMGDAEELKVSLARVHRPWLGYLWMLSWVLAAAALVLFAVSAYSNWWRQVEQPLQSRRLYTHACQALYGADTSGWKGERLALYAPGSEVRLGRATVSVPSAARWQWDDGGTSLYLRVRIVWDRPWEAARDEYSNPLWRFRVNGERCSLAYSAGGWNWREGNVWLYEEAGQADQVTLTYLLRRDFRLDVDLSREVEP